MNAAWIFLHEASKFGKKGGIVPGIKVLTAALEVNQIVLENEVNAGRISSPDYYSEEIRKYEHSALGSSRVI